MIHRTLAALAALPLLLVPFAGEARPATPSPDLEALVRGEAAGATALEVQELWARAVRLRDADALGAEGELDRLLDQQLARPDRLSPHALLLLAAARLQGEDVDPAPIAHALQDLVLSPEESLARGCASLLANPVFRGLNRGTRSELVDRMQAAADDESRSPAYRLDFATAVYRLGLGSDKRKAYALMETFLDSSDAELSAMGALALAEATQSDLRGKLRDVLEELAAVPNERGRLAAAYLQLEDERVYGERKRRDLRAEYEERILDDELPPEFEELKAVLNLVERYHLEGDKVSRQELVTAAVNGMLRWMDPHSNYLDSSVYAKFFQDLEAEYSGIGAYVNEDPDNGLFTIVRPIYSGPAYEAGLMTDDKIVRIGDWPTLGQPEDEIIKRLKGPAGTLVDLYVWRRGMDPELIDRPSDDMKVVVRRNKIEIPAGSRQMLPGGIGLIELTTFSKSSQEQMEAWIPEMIADGMQALILDMRRNSGGLLTEARDVADLFLPPGKIVAKTENRDHKSEVQRTRKPALVPEGMPVVILTSRMTASAAEIVSGALQDHGRATLVGKRTFGKGSVQQLLPILEERQDIWDDANQNYRYDPGERLTRDANGNGEMDYCPRVKLTIARYLLPSGRSIHREIDRDGNIVSEGGVEPEYEVDQPLIDRWRFEERRRVANSEALDAYLDRNYDQHRDLFHQLALNDMRDPSLYPEFDALMVSLETPLGRDDVRTVLRQSVRRRVQDDLGRQFPLGDFVEDVQVQKGIEVALGQLGESVADVREFGDIFDLLAREEAEQREGGMTLAQLEDRELSRVREMLQSARSGGGALTEESIDELLLLIDKLKDQRKN